MAFCPASLCPMRYAARPPCTSGNSVKFPKKCPFPISGWHFSPIYRTFMDSGTRASNPSRFLAFIRRSASAGKASLPTFRPRYSGLPARAIKIMRGKFGFLGTKAAPRKRALLQDVITSYATYMPLSFLLLNLAFSDPISLYFFEAASMKYGLFPHEKPEQVLFRLLAISTLNNKPFIFFL